MTLPHKNKFYSCMMISPSTLILSRSRDICRKINNCSQPVQKELRPQIRCQLSTVPTVLCVYLMSRIRHPPPLLGQCCHIYLIPDSRHVFHSQDSCPHPLWQAVTKPALQTELKGSHQIIPESTPTPVQSAVGRQIYSPSPHRLQVYSFDLSLGMNKSFLISPAGIASLSHPLQPPPSTPRPASLMLHPLLSI